jgi:hypothetical protein
MAEKKAVKKNEQKNIYLVRLNNLYRYLQEGNARVCMNDSKGDTSSTVTYSSEEGAYNLKDLFYQGCNLDSERALKEITGYRSFTETNEIGRFANIHPKHKDVIKSIQFSFKDEVAEVSPLRDISETKKDLYLIKNFRNYNFANIYETYKTAAFEIKEGILKILTEGIVNNEHTTDPDLKSTYRIDLLTHKDGMPLCLFNALRGKDLEYFDQDVRDDLNEILEFWEQSFNPREVNCFGVPKYNIVPGVSEYKMCRWREDLEFHNIDESDLSSNSELFADKDLWVCSTRYYQMFEVENRLYRIDKKEWPKYTQALALLMMAEYTVIRNWIIDTALNETLHNVLYSVRYSSDIGKGEYVLERNLTAEQLSKILEEYNFEVQLEDAFHVEGNTVLKIPVDRYGSSIGTDFLYDHTIIQYILIKAVLLNFYSELAEHFGFMDDTIYNDFNAITADLRSQIIGKKPSQNLLRA